MRLGPIPFSLSSWMSVCVNVAATMGLSSAGSTFWRGILQIICSVLQTALSGHNIFGPREKWIWLFLRGFIGGVSNLCFFYAVAHVSFPLSLAIHRCLLVTQTHWSSPVPFSPLSSPSAWSERSGTGSISSAPSSPSPAFCASQSPLSSLVISYALCTPIHSLGSA